MSPDRLRAVVVMPTYNGAEVVTTALESVARSAAACAHDIAVVVADDASGDDTVAVVDAFRASADLRVEVVAHDRHRGTGAMRNSAIASADADCLLFLDQDDEYLPDHIGGCLDVLAREPLVDFVRAGVVLDRPVHPDWDAAIAGSLTQTLAVRSWLHRLVGGFLEEEAVAVVGCDDVFYGRLLHRHGRGRRLDRRTVRFRHRPGNSFDRQWEVKFSRPPGEGLPSLTGRRLLAAPDAQAAFERRAREVEERVRRFQRTAKPVVGPAGVASRAPQAGSA